jgi:zinc transport system ATP-binding protein
MPVAISLRGLSFAYPGGPPVLRDVDLEIESGEFVAVAGPNGGGKTTLLRVALGLERPQAGTAQLFGEPAHEFSARARLGYLAQRTILGMDAPATVREVVAAGRVARRGPFRPFRGRDHLAVAAAIERVRLVDQVDEPIQRLSGGQQQRAYIAKALAAEPDLIVLDEPTAGVDADAQEAFAALLEELHAELGATIVYVSHEFGAVERYVERLLLVRGGILFDGPPTALADRWHDPSHVHPRL